jgi:hypothetical protein
MARNLLNIKDAHELHELQKSVIGEWLLVKLCP